MMGGVDDSKLPWGVAGGRRLVGMVDSVDLMKVNEIGASGILAGGFLNSYNRARGLISVGCNG